jgi:hypothetical protein
MRSVSCVVRDTGEADIGFLRVQIVGNALNHAGINQQAIDLRPAAVARWSVRWP